MKEFKINIPEGYEIDKENSTFECIKFKPIVPTINTMQDILDNELEIEGCILESDGIIRFREGRDLHGQFRTVSEAVRFSAASNISKLMPYYGGMITKEEWENTDLYKYIITRDGNKIETGYTINDYRYLAFRTRKHRDRFLENNNRVVRNYLMLN